MTITIRITVTEEEYQEAKEEFENVNDVEYTKEMFIEDQLERFYADCREYVVDYADVKAEIIQKGTLMDEYRYPENFEELVTMLLEMNKDEYGENDDTGHLRHVRIADIPAGKYGLYEDHKYIDCTNDVVVAAQFLAEGWEVYEQLEGYEQMGYYRCRN